MFNNRSISVHEASHAVVDAALGAHVYRLRLWRDGSGLCSSDISGMARIHKLAGVLAGGLGQAIDGGRSEGSIMYGMTTENPNWDAVPDMQQAAALAASMSPDAVHRAIRIAKRILQREWHRVDALAKELAGRMDLDADALAPFLPERGAYLNRCVDDILVMVRRKPKLRKYRVRLMARERVHL